MPSESGQQEIWPGTRPTIPDPTPAYPDPQEKLGEPRLKQVNRNQMLLRTPHP
jgi:hypothetical protein